MTSTATNRPPNPACRVCGGEASGFHYGVDSCEGCKGFFRRCLTQGLTNRCTNEEKCEITPVSRNSCQFCRLKKCKMVGMSKEGSRLGRRPKRLKQCQGQTNDSLPPPPPIQRSSNDSSSRYNRMYSNNSIATTLSLQNADFPDNYSHYHFQQMNGGTPCISVAGYPRSIKSEPEETSFLYSDHDSLPPMSKPPYKNSTNGRLSFDEKFPHFHQVPNKNEGLLLGGGQFGTSHIKQELPHCDGTMRSNYGSLENLSRDNGVVRCSSAWDKSGFQLTNSSSSEHLEEGEIPIRMVTGPCKLPAMDRKSSPWLDSSPLVTSGVINDQWAGNLSEDSFALKKSGRNPGMFLQSNFEGVQEQRSHHSFSEDQTTAGVIVKTESMASDDDDNSGIEGEFIKTRYSENNHSFNSSAANSILLETSRHSASRSVGIINGQNFFSGSGFKAIPSASPSINHHARSMIFENNHLSKGTNKMSEEHLCGGLTQGLNSLTLQEVKGPIPQGKLDLIGQVIETITTAHLSTCPYTTNKISEGLDRYEEICKASKNCDLNPNEIWKHFLDNMTPVIQRVVKFSKRLPGFCEIGQEDQISLIKQGSFEVILIRYTKLFRDDSMFVPDMTILVPKDVIEKMPLGDFFQEQLRFASAFNKLELTDDEVGLLSSIMIVCPDRVGLHNTKAIQQLNLLFLQSLYIHMQRSRPDSFDEFFDKAVEILPKIRRINEIHSIKVSDIKLSPSPEVSFPPLHEEVFDETLV